MSDTTDGGDGTIGSGQAVPAYDQAHEVKADAPVLLNVGDAAYTIADGGVSYKISLPPKTTETSQGADDE